MEKQEEIRRLVVKPYFSISEVQDEPWKTPRKSLFIKQRPSEGSDNSRIAVIVAKFFKFVSFFAADTFPLGRVLEKSFSTAVVHKPKPPVFADQLELIRSLKRNPSIGFYYMVYAVNRSSEFYTPYALK